MMFYRDFPMLEASAPSIARSVLRGIVAGLFGGLAYGTLMMIFRPTMILGIGSLVGADSYLGSWTYHLFVSMTIGSIFGLVLGRNATTYSYGLRWGLLYGLTWFILGGLTLSPLMAGAMDRFLAVSINSWVGLLGHLIYGTITGLGTVLLKKRF